MKTHLVIMTLSLEVFSSTFFIMGRDKLGITDSATLSYLISFGVSSSSYFCISFLRNTNQMMRMMRRTPKETPTTAPAITPIPLTSARQTTDVETRLWASLLLSLLDSSMFRVRGIASTHSASWPLLCSFLPPHHCWLCICRLRHCPWSDSSASQSLGFSDLTTAADKKKSRCTTRGFSYYICYTLCSSLN